MEQQISTKAVYAFNPRLKDSTTGRVMNKYHRGYAEPATAEQILQALKSPALAATLSSIRQGDEEKKSELVALCPHYSGFRDNHRAQEAIQPERFTYRTCIDVDDPAIVEKAVSNALQLNADELSVMYQMVQYVEYSARRKAHIWVLMPVGKTIEETQREFCQEMDIPYDESCITPERFIWTTGDEVFRADDWLKPLPEQQVEERREAFLMRGLDVDGRPLKKPDTTAQPATPTTATATTTATTPGDGAVIPADERTRYIFMACMKEAGLHPEDLTEVGGRHNAVKSILSVGANQLLTKGEMNGVLQEMMPQHWQSKDIRQLVDDFYQKYTDENQKMTQFQRQVFARSRRIGSAPAKTRTTATDSHEEEEATQAEGVYGDTASLSAIYANPRPPRLPRKLPALVQAVTSQTPLPMKANVAQGMFPPLGVYPRNLRFRYIDHQYRELRSNCLTIGGTGSGKDTSLKQPLKHITAPMVERDKVSRQRLKEYNDKYNARASNKDKPQRPEDIPIQYITANLTPARLAQLMSDAQGAFLYTHLHEFEQWYDIEGKSGNNCSFKNLKLADDEDNPFGQERAGAQSVNYMGPLGLNWNASTTLSKAQYMFRNVLVDGPLSRVCLATTPNCGLGAPIPVYGTYDKKYDETLAPYIERLKAATGQVYCKQAYRLAERLKAECDQFTQQTQDELFDNLTHRALVHAFRKACLLYVANGNKWEKSIEGFCRWSLHYDLYLKLKFFGDLIRQADSQTHTSHRGPRNLLELLPQEFTRQQAIHVRLQAGKGEEGTSNMLSQWKSRGYILQMTNDSFRKAQ